MINLRSNSFNYEIDNYKYNEYHNVKSYNYPLCKPELNIYLHHNTASENNNIEYYYIFDCLESDVFAH